MASMKEPNNRVAGANGRFFADNPSIMVNGIVNSGVLDGEQDKIEEGESEEESGIDDDFDKHGHRQGGAWGG